MPLSSTRTNRRCSVRIFDHHAVGPGVPGGARHYGIERELPKRSWRVTVFSAACPRQGPHVRGQSVEMCTGLCFLRTS